MTCPNCGGDVAMDDARCPYCGALNPVGAEKAYMDALDDLRDETDVLDDTAESGIKASLLANAKKTVTVIVIAIAVLAALFTAATCTNENDERQALQDYQAREDFRARHFEELDRLYEAGDDDALSEYVWSLMDDPGFDAMFSWKHAGYLEVHDGWQALRSTADNMGAREFGIDDYEWSVALALRLAQFDHNDISPSTMLTPEEEARAAEYRACAHQFLQDTLQMSEDEIAAFADESKDEQGFIQNDMLKKNLEKRLGQLGVLR